MSTPHGERLARRPGRAVFSRKIPQKVMRITQILGVLLLNDHPTPLGSRQLRWEKPASLVASDAGTVCAGPRAVEACGELCRRYPVVTPGKRWRRAVD